MISCFRNFLLRCVCIFFARFFHYVLYMWYFLPLKSHSTSRVLVFSPDSLFICSRFYLSSVGANIVSKSKLACSDSTFTTDGVSRDNIRLPLFFFFASTPTNLRRILIPLHFVRQNITLHTAFYSQSSRSLFLSSSSPRLW